VSEREEWLAKRRNFVTASDCAALLNLSPYKTRDQLRMEKMGLADEWKGNEDSELALLFEERFIQVSGIRFGWNVKPWGLNMVSDFACQRLGATPDAVLETPWGTAIAQYKWTTCQAKEDCEPLTKKGKPSTAAYLNGPPLHYQIQVQAEMACMNVEHASLVVMHMANGTKKLRAYYIPRHDGVIRKIREETMKFWKEIEG
jgi:predicted phage-related endonuclease